MPPALDKPRLRRVLRRLRATPHGGEPAAAAQEALDFLAMMAGVKPVYLYRGPEEPAWTGAVREVAAEQGFRVVVGGYWDARVSLAGLPDWYVRAMRESMAVGAALYVTRTRANAEAVEAVCETLAPSVEEEARLLGYPPCCVAGHYERARSYHQLMIRAATRAAEGDEARCYEMIAAQAPPELIDDEQADLSRVMDMVPLPYTSVIMCRDCVDLKAASPAARLSRRYADLARSVDPDYFAAAFGV
jgi:hypothetical protein